MGALAADLRVKVRTWFSRDIAIVFSANAVPIKSAKRCILVRFPFNVFATRRRERSGLP